MNKREMADVKKVFDNARPACLNPVWPRNQHPVPGIVEQLELWDPASAAAEAHPDDVMRRRRMKGRHSGLVRRELLRVGRHEHAPPIRSIGPTVIGALEPHPVDGAAERQPGASMPAQAAPSEHLLARTPHNGL